MDEAIVLPINKIDADHILYNFEGLGNDFTISPESFSKEIKSNLLQNVKTINLPDYIKAFDKIQNHIKFGETYLLNLTFQSKISSEKSLKDLYLISQSKYKLYLKDKFVCFSPEPFVKIKDNIISSYPMKGTISASKPEARNLLLNNEKELAEHYTIVDLLRNDLSIVSKRVRVENFRFVEEIKTNRGAILQTSSHISGLLPDYWEKVIGEIIFKMLPAGSVTGAPKERTVEIINQTENYNRGYYTGVAGIYDGTTLNSCVLIRFIEKAGNEYYFKSGGGITSKSNAENEYQELLEKIYVPAF